MPKRTTVSIAPNVLESDVLWSALSFLNCFGDNAKVSDEARRKRAMEKKEVLLTAVKYNADHHFGPALTLEGKRSGESYQIEIMIPWHSVRAIVTDETGQMTDIGFAARPRKNTKPKGTK
jgi:hypothetical protein